LLLENLLAEKFDFKPPILEKPKDDPAYGILELEF